MRFATSIWLALALAVFPAASHAAIDYYIVLGSESTEEEAAERWQEAVEAYPDLLGKIKFHPQTLRRIDGTVATRVQAGPLAGKRAAEKLCDKLFASKTQCFLLEDEYYPEEEAAKDDTFASSEPLPWLGQPAPSVSPPPPVAAIEDVPEEESGGFWSSLFGDDPPAAPVDPNASGEVEVAEAIRVPLSEQPAARPTFHKSADAAGWLNVHAFANEESAQSLWEQVRQSSPAQAAGLRVRTVRPFDAGGRPTVSLNIGPFATQEGADTFCRTTIQPVNHLLLCRFERGEPGGITYPITTRFKRGNAYEARRQAMLVKPDDKSRYNPVTSNRAYSQGPAYWIQVASAASQLEAMNRWRAIRADNIDLLEGLRTRISTSLMGDSGYVIRVGPIPGNDQAVTLCGSLRARGIDCKVYSNL